MKPSEIEDLLWQLSSAESRTSAEANAAMPADELLVAYRAGRLRAADEADLERQLARSAAARTRLLKLAELTPESPSSATREAVLSADRDRVRSSWQRGIWLAAALITLLVAYQLILPSKTPDLPADLQFDVRVEGLTPVRSGQLDHELANAYPQTRLRLILEPRSLALAELDFGLYRQLDGQRFELLEPGSRITLETHRGSAVFTAKASDLLGTQQGTYPILLVASRRGQLPAKNALDSASDVEALFHDPAFRAHRLELTLLRPPDDEP